MAHVRRVCVRVCKRAGSHSYFLGCRPILKTYLLPLRSFCTFNPFRYLLMLLLAQSLAIVMPAIQYDNFNNPIQNAVMYRETNVEQ